MTRPPYGRFDAGHAVGVELPDAVLAGNIQIGGNPDEQAHKHEEPELVRGFQFHCSKIKA